MRNQDTWIALVALLRERATQDQAWEYMENNWDKVHAQLTISSGAEVVRATGSFCTAERRDDVMEFFATHKLEASERTLAKAVDSINDCIQLRSSQEPEFRAWLQSQPR